MSSLTNCPIFTLLNIKQPPAAITKIKLQLPAGNRNLVLVMAAGGCFIFSNNVPEVVP